MKLLLDGNFSEILWMIKELHYVLKKVLEHLATMFVKKMEFGQFYAGFPFWLIEITIIVYNNF